MTAMSALASDSERSAASLSDVLTRRAQTAELQNIFRGRRRPPGVSAPSGSQQDRSSRPVAQGARCFDRVARVPRDGLAVLVEAFRRTQGSKDAAGVRALLARQAEPLVASGRDLGRPLQGPRRRHSAQPRVSGVEVPDSNFVQTPDLASNAVDGADLGANQRLRRLCSVPRRRARHQHRSVQIVGRGNAVDVDRESRRGLHGLAFAVAVANSGDKPGGQDRVTLTIQQSPTPILKKQTIDLINPVRRSV